MRRAARTDGNQSEIVEGLRKAGCTVYFIGKPVDLLVGRTNKNWLLEIKNPDKTVRAKLKPAQVLFIDEWRGQVAVVKNLQQALYVVGLAKSPGLA